MRLDIGHALFDGLVLLWAFAATLFFVIGGAVTVIGLTLVFAIVLFGASLPIFLTMENNWMIILSPLCLFVGLWMQSLGIPEETRERWVFVSKDLEKRMKKNSFWKPLFSKKKKKRGYKK